MFTPAQVAQTLTIPPSTLRRWAKRFAPFLSPQSGKKRTYTVADLDAFQRIKDLSAQGYTFAQIDQQANELNAIKEWLRLPFYKRVGKKPPI